MLVDSAPKMAALLQFEQSHLFGLRSSHLLVCVCTLLCVHCFSARFVSVLTTCLDSFLYIESLYSIQDAVLLMQERNTTSSGLVRCDWTFGTTRSFFAEILLLTCVRLNEIVYWFQRI